MTKIRSAYSSSTPIPLSVQREAPEARRRARPRTRRAAAPSPRNLIALAIRFWNTAVSSPASPATAGQAVGDHLAARLLAARSASRAARLLDELARRRRARAARVMPADARELEQVVDQLLHPLGAVDRELDVAVGALVELARVAALEHLREARDLAQRLLQVVRGDVGELLELLVGALQLARLLDQRPLGVAQGADLGDDPLAHRLDVGAQRRDLARAGRLDRALEVPARDRAHAGAEPRERPHDHAPRRERRGDDREQDQHARGRRTSRSRTVRRVVERRRAATARAAASPRCLRRRARARTASKRVLPTPRPAAARAPRARPSIAGSAYSRRHAVGRRLDRAQVVARTASARGSTAAGRAHAIAAARRGPARAVRLRGRRRRPAST